MSSTSDIDRMRRHRTGNHLSMHLFWLISHPALFEVFNWSAICVTQSKRSQLPRLCVTYSRPIISQTWIYGYGCSWPSASRSQSRHICLIYLPCTLLTVNCHPWRHQTRIQTTSMAFINPPQLLLCLCLCPDLVSSSSSSCGLALGQANVTHAKYLSVIQLANCPAGRLDAWSPVDWFTE